jgi:putative NADPH-quinone reductase
MKPKKIVLVQGHPDASSRHFGHALADAYARGAACAGHDVLRIEIARLDFPLLRSQADWNSGPLPAALKASQDALAWADHIVLIFPLWLGTMPAVVKAYLEQVLRPGFAVVYENQRLPRKGLRGKSARVVATMGMPAFWYRLFFRAHGVRGLEQSILGFCGVKPIRETLIGLMENKDDKRLKKWLDRLELLGRKAA